MIMASATLSTGRRGSFEFFQQRIGLTQSRTLKLGSPFDFKKQAKIIVVRGMPDPNQEKEAYERLCAAMIQRYAERTDGHAFALFTSYDMIRRVSERITSWLVRQNYLADRLAALPGDVTREMRFTPRTAARVRVH